MTSSGKHRQSRDWICPMAMAIVVVLLVVLIATVVASIGDGKKKNQALELENSTKKITAIVGLTCFDDRQQPVDWYVLYKFPKLEQAEGKLMSTGEAYAYFDENTDQWTVSEKSIEDDTGALGATIAPLLDIERKSLEHIVYTDQPPTDKLETKKGTKSAHAKGVLAFDEQSGVWISHSIPRFVNLLSSVYDYPDSGRNNGQLVVCVTLRRDDSTTVDNLGQHLAQMRPKIFSSTLSDDFLEQYPVYRSLKKKKSGKSESPKETTFVAPITTARGVEFMSFAKNAQFNDDLYAQLIAPYYKNSLMAQTWRNGAGGKLDSDCQDTYQVINIEQVSFQKTGTPADWKATEDHSKWAVSARDETGSVFCIADINRMKSQFARGGGSLCLESKPVWTAFDSIIEDMESCPVKQSKHKKQRG